MWYLDSLDKETMFQRGIPKSPMTPDYGKKGSKGKNPREWEKKRQTRSNEGRGRSLKSIPVL